MAAWDRSTRRCKPASLPMGRSLSVLMRTAFLRRFPRVRGEPSRGESGRRSAAARGHELDNGLVGTPRTLAAMRRFRFAQITLIGDLFVIFLHAPIG
jgi:hypothetical protein